MTEPVLASDVVPEQSGGDWRNRIVGHGTEQPEQLLANPRNWRIHPRGQQQAVEQALERVGWVQSVIVNQRTGHVVDGHLRVAISISKGEAEIPVVYVDLSDEEEAIVLATLDPLGDLAATDDAALKGLLGDLEGQLDGVLAGVLAKTTRQTGTVAPQSPSADDLLKAQDRLDHQFEGPQGEMLDVTCPHCAGEFAVNLSELKR